MTKTKIVIIGAGSLFGPRLLGDAMQLPQLYGSEIALYFLVAKTAVVIRRPVVWLEEIARRPGHDPQTSVINSPLRWSTEPFRITCQCLAPTIR